MGVLLKEEKFNWLPNNAIHFRFLEDVLKVTVDGDAAQWLREQVVLALEAHFYTLDLREASAKELDDLLAVTVKVLSLNAQNRNSDEIEKIYYEQITLLRDDLKGMLLSTEKNG